MFSRRQQGTYYLMSFVFALIERKNEGRQEGKYRSAAGDKSYKEPAMDKAFWQAVLENECAVPDGHSVASLTPELLAYLGSTDPDLRDDIAFSILATWIGRVGAYTNDELRAIGQ